MPEMAYLTETTSLNYTGVSHRQVELLFYLILLYGSCNDTGKDK